MPATRLCFGRGRQRRMSQCCWSEQRALGMTVGIRALIGAQVPICHWPQFPGRFLKLDSTPVSFQLTEPIQQP